MKWCGPTTEAKVPCNHVLFLQLAALSEQDHVVSSSLPLITPHTRMLLAACWRLQPYSASCCA